MPNQKRAILLTGTIVTNSIHTEHNDPEKRLAEYLKSILFYTDLFCNDTVYFLENSDYNLEHSEAFNTTRRRARFEVLRFPPENKFYEGKGYQEFKMLDEAILKLTQYDAFIKITGRYLIRNASTLTDTDCGGLMIDCSLKRRLADTYIFYCTRSFYLNHFLGAYQSANDSKSRFIEHVIFDRLTTLSIPEPVHFFNKTPLLEGTTGSYGLSLKQNPIRVFLKNGLRFCYKLVGRKHLNF